MKSRYHLVFVLISFLFACQNNQNYPVNQIVNKTNLYLDEKFYSDSILIETEEEVFKIDDEMRAMVNAKLVNNLTANQKARVLLEHLFNEENISLSYEGNANRLVMQSYY